MTALLPGPAEIIDELVIEANWTPVQVDETPFEEVCKLLDNLLKLYGPDYVYPEAGNDCHYLDLARGGVIDYEGPEEFAEPVYAEDTAFKPSCLVGAILVEVKDQQSLCALWESGNNEGVMSIVDYFPPEWAEDKALMSGLHRLQAQQDVGMPWGEAVAEFKEHYQHLVTLTEANVELQNYWDNFPTFEAEED